MFTLGARPTTNPSVLPMQVMLLAVAEAVGSVCDVYVVLASELTYTGIIEAANALFVAAEVTA